MPGPGEDMIILESKGGILLASQINDLYVSTKKAAAASTN